MRSFLLNKLVRDKIFINMQEIGQQVVYQRLTNDVFLSELRRKLLEEAKEFAVGDTSAEDELADILEVIESIADAVGSNFAAVRSRQLKRRGERGGFKDRMFVERLDLADDDPWVDYYAAKPDIFPEA